MNTSPDTCPAPLAAEPQILVNLLGGPHCGDDFRVPTHCHRFDLPDGTHYVFCPHATALRGRDTFLHSSLDHFLCAR